MKPSTTASKRSTVRGPNAPLYRGGSIIHGAGTEKAFPVGSPNKLPLTGGTVRRAPSLNVYSLNDAFLDRLDSDDPDLIFTVTIYAIYRSHIDMWPPPVII